MRSGASVLNGGHPYPPGMGTMNNQPDGTFIHLEE